MLQNDDPSAATGLDYLAALLIDEDEQEEWGRKLDPPTLRLYNEAVMKIGELRAAVGWSEVTVLDELRCRTRTKAQLNRLEAQHFTECNLFLAWVSAVMKAAPETENLRVRRQAISAASKLYESSNKDIGACEEAMGAPVGETDPVTPNQIVVFGEIDTAFLVASWALDTSHGERARKLRDANPFNGSLVHVATTTLDALLADTNLEDSSEFSTDHRERLNKHIGGCDACARAYLARSRLTGLAPLHGLVDEPKLRVNH